MVVTIDGNLIDTSAISREELQDTLRRAHELKKDGRSMTILCAYPGCENCLLHICEVRPSVFIVKSNPAQAENHSDECAFATHDFPLNDDGSMSGVPPLADDGKLHYRLGEHFFEFRPDGASLEESIRGALGIERKAQRRGHVRQTTPAGIVASVLDFVGANVNDPRAPAKHWLDLAPEMTRLLRDVRVNDFAASHAVYVGGGEDLLGFCSWFSQSGSLNPDRYTGLLVAPLTSFDRENGVVELEMAGVDRPVRITEEAWQSGIRRAWFRGLRGILRDWGARNAEVICIVRARADDTVITASNLWFVVTTRNWIQVHSLLELDEVNHLRSESRYFIKPIRPWKGDRFCHDVILLDTKDPFRVELNGWRGAKYTAHKKKVWQHMRATYPKGSIAMRWPKDPPIEYPPPVPEDGWHHPYFVDPV